MTIAEEYHRLKERHELYQDSYSAMHEHYVEAIKLAAIAENKAYLAEQKLKVIKEEYNNLAIQDSKLPYSHLYAGLIFGFVSGLLFAIIISNHI